MQATVRDFAARAREVIRSALAKAAAVPVLRVVIERIMAVPGEEAPFVLAKVAVQVLDDLLCCKRLVDALYVRNPSIWMVVRCILVAGSNLQLYCPAVLVGKSADVAV